MCRLNGDVRSMTLSSRTFAQIAGVDRVRRSPPPALQLVTILRTTFINAQGLLRG